MTRILKLLENRFVVAIMLLGSIGLIAVTGYRTYRSYAQPSRTFDWESRGLSDFHNGTYFPTKAFRNQINPYSNQAVEEYTMSRPAPPFSPTVFILHLPFSYFDLYVADVLFFAYNVFLLFALAYCSIRMATDEVKIGVLLFVFNLLLVSRPGHITLFTGYFTLELALGSVLALHFGKSRPVLAGLGMLLALGKPTYIVPLIILMLCRRNVKAVLIGCLFCFIGGAAGLGWLAMDSSMGEVIQGVKEGQQALHDDPTELPLNTWTRVDYLGMLAKFLDWVPDDKSYLLGMLGFLSIPGFALFIGSKYEKNQGATSLSAYIVLIAMAVSIYHQVYDCLLIAVPWVGLLLFREKAKIPLGRFEGIAISVIAAVPLFNYVSTISIRNLLKLEQHSLLWQSITVVNGTCLLVVLFWICLRFVQTAGKSIEAEESQTTLANK